MPYRTNSWKIGPIVSAIPSTTYCKAVTIAPSAGPIAAMFDASLSTASPASPMFWVNVPISVPAALEDCSLEPSPRFSNTPARPSVILSRNVPLMISPSRSLRCFSFEARISRR